MKRGKRFPERTRAANRKMRTKRIKANRLRMRELASDIQNPYGFGILEESVL